MPAAAASSVPMHPEPSASAVAAQALATQKSPPRPPPIRQKATADTADNVDSGTVAFEVARRLKGGDAKRAGPSPRQTPQVNTKTAPPVSIDRNTMSGRVAT